MTVIIEDSFNRTGANLGSNPAGRWNIPVGDFTVNGQITQTDTTVALSTSPWAHFYAPSVGTKYGESRVQGLRGTAQVKAIGVVARASTITSDRPRYWFGWTNESGTEKFELRLYTTNTAYTVIATVNASTLAITGDLLWHTYAIKITSAGTNLINISCKYDTTLCLVANGQIDVLGVVIPPSYQPGFQLTTSSTWAGATDYAQFENAQFDDLAVPVIESAPVATTEAALTITAVTREDGGVSVGYAEVTPDFGEVITERFFVNRSRSDAGYETTYLRFSVGRKMWKVKWDTISSSDLATLEQLQIDLAQGAYPYYPYASPDGATYYVRFVDDTFSRVQVAPNVYNCEAVFEEVKAS